MQNSTLLNVAFEGGDHRERDESMKDLAGKRPKRHGGAEAKEKPPISSKPGIRFA